MRSPMQGLGDGGMVVGIDASGAQSLWFRRRRGCVGGGEQRIAVATRVKTRFILLCQAADLPVTRLQLRQPITVRKPSPPARFWLPLCPLIRLASSPTRLCVSAGERLPFTVLPTGLPECPHTLYATCQNGHADVIRFSFLSATSVREALLHSRRVSLRSWPTARFPSLLENMNDCISVVESLSAAEDLPGIKL